MCENFTVAETGMKWPSGDHVCIAQLVISPDRLSHILGVELTEGNEAGMGCWVGTAIVLSGKGPLEFVLYEGDSNGFLVRADRKANHTELLDNMLLVLKIDKNSLSWISELIDTQQ